MDIEILTIFFLIFIFLSLVIYKLNSQNIIARTFAFAMAAFAVSYISIDLCGINSQGLPLEVWFLAVDVSIALTYLVSILIFEKYLYKLNLQKKFFYYVIVPFIIANLLIIVATDAYGTDGFIHLEATFQKLLSTSKILVQSFLQIAAALNCIALFILLKKDKKQSIHFLLLASAFAFSALRGTWDTYYYLAECTIRSPFFEIYGQVFYIFSVIFFIYAAIKLRLFRVSS